MIPNIAGQYKRVTGAANSIISGVPGNLVGFYVNSTTGGTITLYDNAAGTATGTQVSGTITPAIGFHWFPASFGVGIAAVTANTIDVTFIFN